MRMLHLPSLSIHQSYHTMLCYAIPQDSWYRHKLCVMDKIRYDMIVINLTILCYIILFIASIKEDLTPYASTMIQRPVFFSLFPSPFPRLLHWSPCVEERWDNIYRELIYSLCIADCSRDSYQEIDFSFEFIHIHLIVRKNQP